MNTTDDLTRSLREQADRIGGHPIDLESVRGKARSIQRRRRVGSAVVAAAVLRVASALLAWDFTVPTEMPSASAVSASESCS